MKSLRKQVFEYLKNNDVTKAAQVVTIFPKQNKKLVEAYYYEWKAKNKTSTSTSIPTYSELIKSLYNDFEKEKDRRVRKEIASEIRQLLKEKGNTPDKQLTILEELELWKQKKSS